MCGIDKKLAKSFEEFLQRGGANILKPSNPWELARFDTANGICVVYQNSKGKISYSNEHAHKAFVFYQEHKPWTAGEIMERIRRRTVEEVLLERDGNACFFCTKIFSPENPATLEHLLAISDGGNNHLSNLVLAHELCNRAAASMPIIEKIKLREGAMHANA